MRIKQKKTFEWDYKKKFNTSTINQTSKNKRKRE